MNHARANFTCAALAMVLLAVNSARAQPSLLTKDAKRECATCHLDWVDAFDRRGALLLVDRPPKPQAAEEPMCLGCHDGSVGDSRRGVWLEHGHRMNEKPSDKIKVPGHMPLDEAGRMVCKTCHTAHTVPGQNDLARIVFLRSAREGGLCQQCHVDRAYDGEQRSHPLAKLPIELPKDIFAAHGRMDIADRTKMACQTCHTAHGTTRDHLLVMGTESGQLCKSCHEQLRPQDWHGSAPREHPQNPSVKDPRQKQAIKAMGTRLAPDDTLTCFSCHKMHDGKTEKFMLADTLKDSALCLRCHEDRKSVLESKHDLRRSAPITLNKAGLKPDESGPCGACHSFHRYARDTKPGAGDPVGVCISCHRSKDGTDAAPAGGTKQLLAFAHPPDISTGKVPKSAGADLLKHASDPDKSSFACYTCHDPHDSSKKLFLRKERDALCSSCHTDRFASMAGKHDFTDKPQLRNVKGETAKESGKCGFCHAVHGDTDLVMWAATKEKPKGPDDLCVQCHRADGLAHEKPAALFGHPTGASANSKPTTRKTSTSLPLFDTHARVDARGFVSCASCHDPHADSNAQKEMLRVAAPVSNLCTTCHVDQSAMAGGPHDPRGKKDWPIQGPQADLCTSCHAPHSKDSERQRYAFIPTKGVTRADGACITCHKESIWAADSPDAIPVSRAMHPTTLPAGHAGTAASGLPLVASKTNGQLDSIGCKTCHNPHANPKSTPHLTRAAPGQAASTLCTQCHTENAPIASSMHANDALAAHAQSFLERDLKSPADPKSPACSPCHSTHAIVGSEKRFLWAAKTSERSNNAADNRCLSCHETSTDSSRKLVFEHPEEPLRAQKWSATKPSTQPAAQTTQIGCATCHVTHGDPSFAAGAPLDLNARRAARPMIRSGASEQCAHCHGLDAARLMLYWHDPAKQRKSRGLLKKQE